MEEAAEKQAEIEIELIKPYFDDLTEQQLRILHVAFKSAYRSGHVRGFDDASKMFLK